MTELPPGFVLDQAPQTEATGLPEGFVLDAAPAAPATSTPGYAKDIAKSIPAGAARGVAAIAGLPDLIGRGINWAERAVSGETPEAQQARLAEKKKTALFPDFLPSTEDATKAIERVTGPLYKPQTIPGQFAGTVAEFVPGALMGPGGLARNALRFGVAPGLASEAAGQATKGTDLEPYARAGAALATGVGAAYLGRPNNIGRTVANATEGVTPQQLDAAERLFNQAQQMGAPITRAEAVQHVTGGATQLGDLQRVVEGSGRMRDTFAQRPAQNEAAFTQAVRNLEPNPTNAPSTIGPAVGTAAEGAVNDVRGVINQASDPYYTAASTVRLTPQEMARVRALPGYPEASAVVRGDPQLNRTVAHLPEDSVGFLNEVKKQLDIAAQEATGSIRQQPNMQRHAGFTSDAQAVRDAAVRASPEYEQALLIQSQSREQFLEPLLQGPLGGIANKDTTTQKAIEVLFPRNPIPNSADEVGTAVSAVAQRNPWAARQLVRAHAESVFNQAARNLQSGPNQFGGAGFAAAIRGNPQQAANLEAAVRSLPNGGQTWTGFNRFLEVMEAQGTRQRIGSQTAFNAEALAELKRGKAVGEAITDLAGLGVKWPQRIRNTVERWRLGQNTEQLAELFTNPEAGRLFRRLATQPSTGNEGAAVVGRLIYLASQPTTRPAPSNNSRP
jgi:hypothetical protein